MNALVAAAPHRRGACPGLSAPMPTGDGLLVRLKPVGTMSIAAFRGLCAAARRHGNGVIEVTARGSIQVRGLSAASAPRFADAIASFDIAAEDNIPVITNALAGLDPGEIIDAGALAAELGRALGQTSLPRRLAPKVSVAIDGGGALDLDTLSADVRLSGKLLSGAVALSISVGGDRASATQLGTITPSDCIDTSLRLLEVIARRGREARARDVLAAEGIEPFRESVRALLLNSARPRERAGLEPDSRLRGNERKVAIGLHSLRDGSCARGVSLAFGHAEAATLELLADAAEDVGAHGIRTAPGRALIAIGLTREAATAFAAAAERLGFIVRADDPRRHVIACAGAPICASAQIASRAMAPRIAEIAARSLDDSFEIHVSGCAKGCAHPTPAAVTLVGTPDGCALVANGTARDVPSETVLPADVPAAIARYVEARHV